MMVKQGTGFNTKSQPTSSEDHKGNAEQGRTWHAQCFPREIRTLEGLIHTGESPTSQLCGPSIQTPADQPSNHQCTRWAEAWLHGLITIITHDQRTVRGGLSAGALASQSQRSSHIPLAEPYVHTSC